MVKLQPSKLLLSVRIRLPALDSIIAILLFTQLLLMTTSLKPRPVYKKRTITKKTMTEQTKPSLETLTKVQSHLPDVQLIDRNALWEDLKNRVKINNYECRQAMKDLKKVVAETNKLASPYVNKAVAKVEDFRSNF